jgi:hypothetical protein
LEYPRNSFTSTKSARTASLRPGSTSAQEALDVPVSSFYIGLPEPSSLRDEKGLQASPPVPTGDVSAEETGHLSRVMSGIDDPKLRRKIVELVDALAEGYANRNDASALADTVYAQLEQR